MSSSDSPSERRLVYVSKPRPGPLAEMIGRFRKSEDEMTDRKPEPRAKPRHVPRPAVRRRWNELLEYKEPSAVEAMLSSVAMQGTDPDMRVPIVDAGVSYGGDRYPTRAFLENWLGIVEDDPDKASYRTLALAGIGLATFSGMIYLVSG